MNQLAIILTFTFGLFSAEGFSFRLSVLGFFPMGSEALKPSTEGLLATPGAARPTVRCLTAAFCSSVRLLLTDVGV